MPAIQCDQQFAGRSCAPSGLANPCRQAWIIFIGLRQVVRDLVVIAFVGTEDMTGKTQPGRPIQRARKNRKMCTRSIPEKVGATAPAKPAMGRFRRAIPGHVARDLNILAQGRCRSNVVPARFSALLTVAGDDRAQRTCHAVCDSAAEAGSCRHPAHAVGSTVEGWLTIHSIKVNAPAPPDISLSRMAFQLVNRPDEQQNGFVTGQTASVLHKRCIVMASSLL